MKIPTKEPFGAIDFGQIKLENLASQLSQALEESLRQIHLLAESQLEPSFENTVEALENVGHQASIWSNIIFNLNHAHSQPLVLEAAKQASELLSRYSSDILLNEKLFDRVEQVFQKQEYPDIEGRTLLEKTYKGFVRNGSKLNETQKIELRDLDQRLSKLSVEFGENVRNQTAAYELWVENPEDIEGIPERALQAAASLAASKGKMGWCFSLFAPSYVPFVTYCPNRELRKQIQTAYSSRAKTQNLPILKKIIALRAERARLLGYDSHADYVLEERMAQSKQQVLTFLDELRLYALPYAQKELAEMQQFALKEGIDELKRWDWAFLAEKLKQQHFLVEQEKLRQYFELQNVLNGIFEICKRLFDLQFFKCENIPVYQGDVMVFEVRRKDKFQGLLYLDLFARETKNPGAWKTNFIAPSALSSPHVSIVCNFGAGQPTLLSFDEVHTLFHEFGHALHSLLSECRYESLGGTNTTWDFVELPSQLFENWCYEPEGLALFARHYQSNEPLDADLVQNIKKMAVFQAGYTTMRQLGFAYLDMACHTLGDLQQDFDAESFEREILLKTDLLEPIEGAMTLPTFSHIFEGGYSSGYYSYKWAEVLEANAYHYFKEKGFLNPQAGEHFRSAILSKGGSDKAMNLFVAFLGHKPKTEALIEKLFGSATQ